MKLHPDRWPVAGIGALAGAMAALCSLPAHAGGFALVEHGASGMGNAYAGAAAVSADTSTIWFNPAGMSEIKSREISVGFHSLTSNTEWTDQGSTLSPAVGGGALSGPDTANPGTTAFLPNFYYVAPINDVWSYGLGIGAPYGSSTEYDRNWKGRYTTVKSGISVIDINPAVSYRVSDKVRLGGGISLQLLSAELGSAVDSGVVCGGTVGQAEPAVCFDNGLVPGVQANDSYGEITGDSTAISFNLGALFLPRDDVKIGVAYRHGAKHEADVDGDFTTNATLRGVLDGAGAPLSAVLNDSAGSTEVNLPATFMVSGAYDLNERVQLLADVTWTGWSSFDELRVEFDNPVQPDSVSRQDWEDVFRFSGGVNFILNPQWTLRGGVALDQEAIPSPQRRTARIPGNDRTWIAFGAGYNFNQNASLDVGYARLFLDETPIDNPNTETAGGSVVRGLFESSVDILSVQFSWQFN